MSSSGPVIAITDERPSPGVGVIAVRGQIDLYSAPELKMATVRAIEDGVKDVVLDLTETSFMDSTGLGVLVGVMKRVSPMGGSVRIVCPDPGIRRLFELSGLADRFPIYDSREQLQPAR